MHYGDFNKGEQVVLPFNTTALDGSSVAMTQSGTLRAYIDQSLTEVTAGLAFTGNYDGWNGLQNVVVNTSGSEYPIGSTVRVAVTSASIGGKTVHAWLGSFSLNRARAEMPYVGTLAAYTDLSTITLPSVCPPSASALVGMTVIPVHGTGKDQGARVISGYTADRVATVDPPFSVPLDTTTSIVIYRTAPFASSSNASIASAVRTELTTELGRIDVAVSTRAASSSLATLSTTVSTVSSSVSTNSANLLVVSSSVSAINTKIGTPSASLAGDISALPAATTTAVLSWTPFTGYSLARVLRNIGTIIRGTKTGGNTNSEVFTAPDSSSTVTVTADEDSNRSSVVDTASNTP